ncbi:DUF1934 domain-containing protein [Bacillaceae bacterium W0354]
MSNETLNVNINIYTEIEDENGSEAINRMEKGTFIQKGGVHVIKYDEDIEEVGLVNTTVVIYDDRITVKREGALKMHQIFKIGQNTESTYRHPYGMFRMETTTHRMEYLKGIGNRSGRIFIVYDVVLNEQEPRTHIFELQFQEEDF